jgi:hypothetical protein
MAGCSIQARPYGQEASDAAVAVCNLGLESGASLAPGERTQRFLCYQAGTALPATFSSS